jgi:hypothetical protein
MGQSLQLQLNGARIIKSINFGTTPYTSEAATKKVSLLKKNTEIPLPSSLSHNFTLH